MVYLGGRRRVVFLHKPREKLLELLMRTTMADLTPGFRFFPTEEELLTFYLPIQLQGRKGDVIDDVIPVLDIYCIEPWDLPKWSGKCCREDREQWFFFSPRQEREAKGGRPRRTTATGYWKATGSTTHVYSSNSRLIGLKRTMVFYMGKAPTGRKTKWKMNEYRAIQEMPSESTAPIPQLRHEFSLCRVYVVSGSVRAFDRRPELQPPESMAETVPESRQRVEAKEKASNSGNFPEIAGIGSDWEMDEDFEKNLVDLEELD